MSVKQCLEVIISTNLPHILMNVHRKLLQFDKFEQEFKVGAKVMFSDLEMTQVRLVWSVQVCKVGAQVMFSDLEMTQVRLVRFVQECDLLFATDWPKLGSKDSNPLVLDSYEVKFPKMYQPVRKHTIKTELMCSLSHSAPASGGSNTLGVWTLISITSKHYFVIFQLKYIQQFLDVINHVQTLLSSGELFLVRNQVENFL